MNNDVPITRSTSQIRLHTNTMRKSVRWSLETRDGITQRWRRRQRRPLDTSASRIKYPGSRDIVAVKKTWAIFQRNKLPESFSRASNESSRLSDSERDSLLVSPPTSRAHDNREVPVGGVARHLRIRVNAVYAGNYMLDRSFTSVRQDGTENSIRKRKLPREKSARRYYSL